MGELRELVKDVVRDETKKNLLQITAVGGVMFAQGTPVSKLEEILISHHDEYGDFSYENAAKDIKEFLIKHAKILLNKPEWYEIKDTP